MRLDPVTLEIFGNKVLAACEEMNTTLQRTSRTLFVKEAADFACALVDLEGRIIAHPRDSGCSLFVDLDAMPTIRLFDDLGPGDIILTNDPYLSGSLSTHLPDLNLGEPYYYEDRLVCYAWTFVHSTDVGGAQPGSMSPSFHEIFQEGIRIPPVKLMERGVLNDDVVNLLKANCRIPDVNWGDTTAMLAALRIGKQRVYAMIERHGLDTFLQGQKDLQDYSEAKTRAVLGKIPNGTYEFWDYLDDDYVTPIPTRIRVRMTVEDGTVHMDVTGTDPQVPASFNICAMDRMHEWLTIRFITYISTHDPSVILNHGLFRPITMTNPRGTILNCEYPAAVGHRHAPARRLNDVLTGAILKAAPETMASAASGTGCALWLAEYPEDGGGERRVSVIEYLRGGMGAYIGHDGQGYDGVDGRDSSIANLSNNPLEVVERECGVIVRNWDVLPDSGGPGRWRGGTAATCTIEIVRDGGAIYGVGMERMRFPAWGFRGGKPGQMMRVVVNQGRDDEYEVGKIEEIRVDAGDTITVMLPGAGGYGDPYLRDPEAVLRDVRYGFVTEEGARRDYGVAIADGGVDEDATAELRSRRIKDNVHADFDFGPEREAWESVFDDATMNALNARLFALPVSERSRVRARIFTDAIPDLPRCGDGRSVTDVITDPDAVRARLQSAIADAFADAPGPGAEAAARAAQ